MSSPDPVEAVAKAIGSLKSYTWERMAQVAIDTLTGLGWMGPKPTEMIGRLLDKASDAIDVLTAENDLLRAQRDRVLALCDKADAEPLEFNESRYATSVYAVYTEEIRAIYAAESEGR